MFRFLSFLTIASMLLIGASCYRMPCADDYSVVPVTNNPDNTGDTNATPGMPTLSY